MSEEKHINKEELISYQNLVAESVAWSETIKQAITVAVEKRMVLRTNFLLFWKNMMLKHDLDEKKEYKVDLETGKISLVEKPKPDAVAKAMAKITEGRKK